MESLRQRNFVRPFILVALFAVFSVSAPASIIVRTEIEPGAFAAIRGARDILLECRPPKGDTAKQFLTPWLAEPESWKNYQGRMAVAIPYRMLSPKGQRRVLEALFPKDYVDEQGWWHTVVFEGEQGVETWWALSDWLTGNGEDFKTVMAASPGGEAKQVLRRGDQVLIPMRFLKEAMQALSPHRPPPSPIIPALEEPEDPVEGEAGGEIRLTNAAGDLAYGRDEFGHFAAYRLKKGEAVYTSVVIRFTDYRENSDINSACEAVLKRSNIRDPRKIEPGQQIRIPLGMLSDRYQPEGSAARMAFEEVRQEAALLEAARPRSRGLEGVLIVLDPGHGGRDFGANYARAGLYEDEITYDISVRIKKLLETTTAAKVVMTLHDPDQGFEASSRTSFKHDTDEEVLVTPAYKTLDAKIAANLRWYLVNDIYRKALKAGADEQKMLFASIHCDALYHTLRGTMVYIPGAQYRRDREEQSNPIYAQFAEYRNQPAVTTTASMRRRDEAMSRNFAQTLLQSIRTNNPPLKVHDTGDPIRNVIRQSANRAYVPAVLRNTMIPTKVLVETANINNAADRERLSDPDWRQWYAEAFVNAVKKHFDG